MRLGSIMPNFNAVSTKGPINFYDWQADSWVVFFSHPADFTPVCTTELGRIGLRRREFIRRNTKCLALSVDTLRTHLDWVNDIRAYCLDVPGDFPYPIIADPKRDLAAQFDMLDDDQKNDPANAKTIRVLYIISPDHKVRLSMFYPSATGRNIDEIFRCIDSLQLTDRLKIVVTPVNWTPGTEVMILPTVTDEEANKLFPNGFDKVSMPSGVNYVRTTKDY